MKINYGVTGTMRKTLVVAISEELTAKVKYLGMPSAAYQIGDYKLDKNGVLEGPDNRSLVAALQGLHSFVSVSEEYAHADEAEIYAERELRRIKLESQNAPDYSYRGQYGGDEIPCDWESGLTEEDELGLGRSYRENSQGENGMSADDVPDYFTYRAELSDPDWPERMEIITAENDLKAYRLAMDFCKGEVILLELHELDENYEPVRWVDLHKLVADNDIYDTLEIEISKNGMTDIQVQNLLKLVESKHKLIAKALGRPLVIKDSDEMLLFDFPYAYDTEAGKIYAQFATALINFVVKHQRVTAKEREVDSEKYALRTLMLRLEMKGRGYADSRRFLLRNLSGNSSHAKNTAYAAMQVSRRSRNEG